MRSPTLRQFIVALLAFSAALLLLSVGSKVPSNVSTAIRTSFETVPLKDQGRLDNVRNDTLGFQKLLVINLPEHPDRRNALTLAAALTNLTLEFLPGRIGDSVDTKSLPPGNGNKLSPLGRGKWSAHIGALRTIVDQGLASAVVLEDDIDWDVRIKRQFEEFANSTRALLQPLKANATSSKTKPKARTFLQYADESYPKVLYPEYDTGNISYADLPSTVPPKTSPYGDDWDVLWLGHCGVRRPESGLAQPWEAKGRKIPRGYVHHEKDDTVPAIRHLEHFGDIDPKVGKLGHQFKNHTRIVHHALDGTCTFAYAVSQEGARKLLYELGVLRFDDYYDIMLRSFCDGQPGHPQRHTCLTVQPTLFDHYEPLDPELDVDTHTIKRERGFSNYIRSSTRLNIPRLLTRKTDYIDQWPNA